MFITVCGKQSLDFHLHICSSVIVGDLRRIAMKICIGLYGQVVRREVRRRIRNGAFNIRHRVGNALPGQSVHDIEVEIPEVLTRNLDGGARLLVVVYAAEGFEPVRVEALDADRQPVDAGSTELAKLVRFERAGVRLERDLGIAREQNAGAHCRQDRIYACGRKQAGRAAAEKHRLHRAPPHQR